MRLYTMYNRLSMSAPSQCMQKGFDSLEGLKWGDFKMEYLKNIVNFTMSTNINDMIIDTERLQTPANYARSVNKSRQYIHKLIKEGKIESVPIDGVPFIIKNKFEKG